MKRACSHCQRPFTAKDFIKEESRHMETDRRLVGLRGVRFLYYHCPDCGLDDIFVDILHLEGESAADHSARTAELAALAEELRAEKLDIVVTDR